MKKNPCIDCPDKGCGPYHDVCKDYQEFINDRKLDREDIRKRYEFTRSERKRSKK